MSSLSLLAEDRRYLSNRDREFSCQSEYDGEAWLAVREAW